MHQIIRAARSLMSLSRCGLRILICMAFLTLTVLPLPASESELVLTHELRGLTVIRLDVDGLPHRLQGSDVSEVSIAASVLRELKTAGITILATGTEDIPTLHVRVLAPLIDTRFFYSISVELEETCNPKRMPKMDLPGCTTWSITPLVSTLELNQAPYLEKIVLQAVDQFIADWKADNVRKK